MSLEVHFVGVFVAVMAYVVVGNYIYLAKVLPILRKADRLEAATPFPYRQLTQARECQRLLAERGERGPVYWYLRALPTITFLLAGAMLTVIVRLL